MAVTEPMEIEQFVLDRALAGMGAPSHPRIISSLSRSQPPLLALRMQRSNEESLGAFGGAGITKCNV